MIDLRVGVLTHPARAARLYALLGALDEDDTPVHVETDDGSGYWPTAVKAWRALIGGTHALLLQDDVVPCIGLRLTCRFALEAQPNYPVSLFSASTKIRLAAAEGYAWAVGRSLCWSQGIILRSDMIDSWLRWTEQHCRADIKSHDARLSAFLLAASVPVYYTVPCLVEHDAPNDSLIGNNRGAVIRRTAGYFPGPMWSGMTIDWRNGLDNPFRLPTPAPKEFAAVLKPDSPFYAEFAK